MWAAIIRTVRRGTPGTASAHIAGGRFSMRYIVTRLFVRQAAISERPVSRSVGTFVHSGSGAELVAGRALCLGRRCAVGSITPNVPIGKCQYPAGVTGAWWRWQALRIAVWTDGYAWSSASAGRRGSPGVQRPRELDRRDSTCRCRGLLFARREHWRPGWPPAYEPAPTETVGARADCASVAATTSPCSCSRSHARIERDSGLVTQLCFPSTVTSQPAMFAIVVPFTRCCRGARPRASGQCPVARLSGRAHRPLAPFHRTPRRRCRPRQHRDTEGTLTRAGS